MKPSTRLDLATFQLTPTRTRCDLVISANGKTEKIASGLLSPFLAHLKTAQQQMAKGGYSIVLEPQLGIAAAWFTRSTVERFVRFVSTPEILERVYTIESEILQIEEAVLIQANNDIGPSVVDDNQAKPADESIEGSRSILDSNDEKAIVLYKPVASPTESNGSTATQENSKVQLLKVLEARKSMLQKEQGMAFARAKAAGFDIDNMSPLMSFAECFGASRLMDACNKFKDLWKRKHETGQWLEIEAAEVSSRSDFSAMNASGIILTDLANKQREFNELALENNGKASSIASPDPKPPMMHTPVTPPPGQQDYFQGQYPQHVYPPPWPVYSPPGTLPVYQAYPMQGMPYYQHCAGNSPYFPPPYPLSEDGAINSGRRTGQKRHSIDSNIVSETDDVEMENGTSDGLDSRQKASKSGKKKSGKMVVIRNINYITSKGHGSSDSESQSDSESETDEEEEGNLQASKSSKSKENHAKSLDQEEILSGKEAEGHWQAFQNFLLRDADEEKHTVDEGMFTMEKGVKPKGRNNRVGEDPLILGGKDRDEIKGGIVTDMERISGKVNRIPNTSHSELLTARQEGIFYDNRRSTMDGFELQYAEMDGKRNGYRRNSKDEFMIHGEQTQQRFANGFDHESNNYNRKSSNNMDDDSYIVPFRSLSVDQVGDEQRNGIDMDSEFPSHKEENLSNRVASQVNYEPDELTLMPDRGTEKGSTGYDPALDYEMQVRARNVVSLDGKNKDMLGVEQGAKKLDKDRKSKIVADGLDKRKTGGPVRKGRPSKLSPLDEARARAEKLRTYKAGLQKMKKEKEEEEIKRLEALKLERQKRIAARGSSVTAQSLLSSQQNRKMPTKFSPSSQKTSKFSDSEPGPLSPHQRFPIRPSSIGSNDSNKTSKSSRLHTGNHSAENRLTRSASSLPEPKENSSVTKATKVTMARIRRLSEPKVSSNPQVSSGKLKSTEPVSKKKITNGPNGPESKKISAIMNLDRSKAATLPELKIRTSKGPNATEKKNMTSVGTGLERNHDKGSNHSEGDDNPVIEKTVVMLECQKPSVSKAHALKENNQTEKRQLAKKIEEKTDVVSNFGTTSAPVSEITMDRLDREPTELKSLDFSYSAQVTMGNSEETPKFSSTITSERPYQAPYAQVSSLEDPCAEKSEYCKVPPTHLEIAASGLETVKVHIPDYGNSKLEKISESLEKTKVEESSKGFRRLLKFGRKNHKGERIVESDNASISGSETDYNATNSASSSEVPTLKNLISQDETPQKSSRTFSLLSPFRSKNSEKKVVT